jgi:hypothetical protein
MKYRLPIAIVIAIVLTVLPACTTVIVQPTQRQQSTIAPVVAKSPLASATTIPSKTQKPKPTSILTDTPAPTSTKTPTSTSTPTPVFSSFSVEFAETTSYGMLLGFQIAGVKDVYRLEVDGVAYNCSLSAKAPDHLYCYGQPFKSGKSVTLVFYQPTGDKIPIYQTTYKVMLIDTPTLSPDDLIAAGKACKIRGVHVTCESEYRKMTDTTYCEVATCVDLCGYYYSVDTCPTGAELNGYVSITGTPPLPPDIYNP